MLLAVYEAYANCTAATPCEDKSSLTINDFVGEAWWFIAGVLVTGWVYELVRRKRLKRLRKRSYRSGLEALRNVTGHVYDDKKEEDKH